MKSINFLFFCSLILCAFQSYSQSISVELDHIETHVTSYEFGNVVHNAFLDFDIDFGSIPLENIESFTFDVKFTHNSYNVIDFYLDANEAIDLFQTCLGASVADITLVQNTGNSRTYRYSAAFNDANIPTINNQICPLLATVVKNVIVTPIDIDDTIFDCEASDFETANIDLEISNTSINLFGGLQSSMATANQYSNVDLPTCGHPLLDIGEYSLHAEKYENANGQLMLDLFLRFNDYPFSGNINFFYGNIRMDFGIATFDNPFLTSGGIANATLTGSAQSILSYNFDVLLENVPNTNYHLGTVGFESVDYNNDCLRIEFNTKNDFPQTIILDLFNNELNGVDYRPILKCGNGAVESIVINQNPSIGSGKLAFMPLQVSQIPGMSAININSDLKTFNSKESVDLFIQDLQGKTLYHQNLGNVSEAKLNRIVQLNNIQTGIYLIQLVGESNIQRAKVLLQAF